MGASQQQHPADHEWSGDSALQWATFIAACIAAGATVAYAIFAYKQWRASEVAALASERSANAAKQSADLLAKSERPHIGIDGVVIEKWDQGVDRTVHCLIHNYGKTPARLKCYTLMPTANQGLDLQGPPMYGEPVPTYGNLIPGRIFQLSLSWKVPILTYAPSTMQGMYEAGLHLFIYGYVEYEDLDGNGYRSCFNFRYGPPDQNIFVNAGDASYWQYT